MIEHGRCDRYSFFASAIPRDHNPVAKHRDFISQLAKNDLISSAQQKIYNKDIPYITKNYW